VPASTLDDEPTQPPSPLPAAVLDIVRATFGFDTLRPLQADSIAATLAGRDSLTVMPTGGGKSLCYQVPPLVTGTLTLIVSPLIALMRDQVAAMQLAGVPAAALHSHLDQNEQREIWQQAQNGELRLLLIAPERLLMADTLSRVKRLSIGAVAIDEAHCISQWGHDFRPEYRRLAELRSMLPGVPIAAYTATATPRVRDDIVRQLQLRDPAVLVGVFDRPNLTYRVLPRVDLAGQVVEALRRHADRAAIVYCITRKDTEALAATLTEAGLSAAAYHAGLDATKRTRVSEKFRDERLDVVVATVAFGMGIDRGDVRCVIHASMPKSVEHYQQETGRAGRDGLPAECLMLYSAADVQTWRRIMDRGTQEKLDQAAATGDGDVESVRAALEAQGALLEGMHRFAGSARCRHRLLTEYFGQTYDKPDCGACDVCLKELADVPDAHDTARKIISCVARCREGFGAGHIADVLMGKASAKIVQRGHDTLSTFGLLSSLRKEQVVGYINQLIDAGDLGRTEGEYPVLYLTPESAQVLRNERTATLVEPKAIPTKPRRQRASAAGAGTAEAEPLTSVEQQLFELLRKARRAIADERHVPPFVVLDDNSLQEICRVRPASLETLVTVRGIGQKKAENFGDDLLRVVREGAEALGLDLDARAGSRSRRAPVASSEPDDPPRLSGSSALAAPHFRRGDSIEAVAKAIGRAVSTTNDYLAEFVAVERPESIRPWVDEATEQRILDAARGAGETGRLKPIYEALNAHVAYHLIKIVLTHHFTT